MWRASMILSTTRRNSPRSASLTMLRRSPMSDCTTAASTSCPENMSPAAWMR